MKQRTTKEFTDLCKHIHNNKYDYTKTVYVKKDKKVLIICPIHGEFEQIANSHIRGSGCKKCSFKDINKKSLEDFIKEAKTVHGNKYDYSLVEYNGTNKKVKIICPIHGEFEQTPHNHLNKKNCKKCGSNEAGKKRRSELIEFINKSNQIHNKKYNYSKVEYKNSHTKVTITCPTHGDFNQSPQAHLNLKQGCPECFNQLRKYNAPSWTKENWVSAGKKSKLFESFKLYVIKCNNENETFIKVGRTYLSLNKRFSQIPYEVEIIKVISGEGDYIFDLEKRFKQLYKKYRYLPLINFGGKNECFIYNIKTI